MGKASWEADYPIERYKGERQTVREPLLTVRK